MAATEGCSAVLQQPEHSGDQAIPSCPICLADSLTLREQAVINPCMHIFCKPCLLKWLDYKRSCPLCKGRVGSFFYDISEAGEYLERPVPVTPPRQPLEPSGLPLIDEARASTSYATQRPREQNFWAHPSRPRSQRFRRTPSQNTNEPRPYYHRVRAMMSAPGTRASGEGSSLHLADPRHAAEEHSLLWRRHIYTQGLYAQPLKLDRRVASSGPSPSSQRRIEDWVHRELRAILQTDDVSLLRSFIMGLAISARLLAGSSPSEEQDSRDGGAHQEAVRALEPFLHNQAKHFWHELRSFAHAPFSMTTWDRLVQYQDGPLQATGQGSSCEGNEQHRYSLWNARRPRSTAEAAAPPQQSAQPVQAPAQMPEPADVQQQSTQSQGMLGNPQSIAPELDHTVSSRTEPSTDCRRQEQRQRKPPRGERRCAVSGRSGCIGLCLDCAERQAAEEEEKGPNAAAPSSSNLPEALAARQPGHGQMSNETIGRLAAERLRALLGSGSTTSTDATSSLAGEHRSLAQQQQQQQKPSCKAQEGCNTAGKEGPVINLCSDSDDDVVCVTPVQQPTSTQKVHFVIPAKLPVSALWRKNSHGSKYSGHRTV